MQPKFRAGQRVRMFDAFEGTVKSLAASGSSDITIYTVVCDFCTKEHLLLEEDMQKVEEQEVGQYGTTV